MEEGGEKKCALHSFNFFLSCKPSFQIWFPDSIFFLKKKENKFVHRIVGCYFLLVWRKKPIRETENQ